MDVRCDRCETEYELDDAIVTEAGASVQCTTCGHTFIVTRRSSAPLPSGMTPPAGIADPAGPNVPEWTLSTDDGKVHRFRDLNTLQKWIVERKVTRSDRISRSGGPWLSLGDVVELTPFFNVVDEADRARPRHTTGSAPAAPGAISTVRARTASGQFRSMSSAVTPPPVPIEARKPISEDGPTVPNRPLPGFVGAVTPSIPQPGIRASEPRLPGATPAPRSSASSSATSSASSSATSSAGPARPGGGRQAAGTPRPAARTELVFGANITEESRALEADFLRPSKRGRNVVIGFVVLLMGAGGAGYWWWSKQQQGPVTATTAVPPARPPVLAPTSRTGTSPADPGAAPGASKGGPPSVPAPGSGGSPAAVVAVAPSKAEAGKGIPSPVGAGGAAVATAPGATDGSGTATPRGRGAAAPTGHGRNKRGHTDAGSGSGASYDRLVSDADRLLDRGKSAKADKLYAQALAVHPDGVAALTGSAYVLLDRQRHFKAIETFRRALGIQPGYGPALFGIAESYRARGDTAQALAAYRQYLAVAPSGTDAPAARRQIKDLEGAASSTPQKERPGIEPPVSGEVP